jgi:hypothetical protein
MQKSLERMADMLLKVNDKSRTSMERLTQSIEKQAAAYGKTGVERMIAERDRLIKKLGDEQGMVDRVTAAYSKMIAAESGNGTGGGFEAMGRNIQGFIRDPLNGAKEAAGGLLEKIGPIGTGVGIGAAALTAFAVAGWEAAKSLASYGLEIKNVELRTGLTSKEVGQFGFAARMAGQDVSIFERMMKGLVSASEEGGGKVSKASEALQRMGIELRTATGEMKPTSQLLLEISGGLGKLPEGLQRDAAAMDLFKKVGVEAIPVISGLVDNVKRAKEMGLGATEEDLRRWEKYHEKVTEAEVLWEKFTRKIKEPLAAVITFFLKDEEGHHYTLEDLAKRGVNLGKYAPRTRAGDLAAAKAAGFGNPEAEQWERNIAQSSLESYLDKVGARQKGDAAVRSFEASQGLAGQLKRAEESLSGMTKPTIGVSSIADVNSYSAAEKQVQSLKNQIEAGKQAAEKVQQFHRAAAEFSKHGDEAEMSAIEKIYYQRDQLIKQAEHMKGVEADIAAIRKSANEQAGAVAKKDWEKFDAYAQEQQEKRNRQMLLMMGPSKEQLKEWEEGFAAQDRIAGINLQSQKDTLNRNAGKAQQMVGLSGLTGTDAINATYQIRIDLAKQLAVVEANRISQQEKSALQAVEIATAQKDLQKAISEAQEESQMKMLELEKQRTDMLKKESEGLWNTLLTHPTQFGKQLAGTVHSAVLKPITEGLAGMTANVLKPVIYGSDGQSGIAGFFKGMFGGAKQDPMKMATDMNTAVTAQNSAALSVLTAILAGAMGMAAPAIAAPAGIGGLSLPSISAPAVSTPGGIGGMSLPSFSIPAMAGGGGGGVVSAGGGNPLSMIMGGGGGGGQATAAGGSGGGGFAGIPNMLRNFKGINWGGLTRTPDRYRINDVGGDPELIKAGHINGVNGVAGAALFAGGSMLAQQGLLGSSRGTWGGVAMGGLGGAAIGFQMGGPLGALIGGAAGALIGIGEKIAGVETPENEAKRLVKQIYSLNIDNATAKQIAAIAKQSYGGHVSSAVRSPEVRQLLQLVAESTGQKSNLFLNDPHGVNLTQSGGNLYQSAVYNNGTPYTYSSNLPVMGPAGSTIPTGNPYAGGVTVMVSPEQTTNLWSTGVAAGIAGSPRQVAASAVNGGMASSSRVAGAIMTLAPNQVPF